MRVRCLGVTQLRQRAAATTPSPALLGRRHLRELEVMSSASASKRPKVPLAGARRVCAEGAGKTAVGILPHEAIPLSHVHRAR